MYALLFAAILFTAYLAAIFYLQQFKKRNGTYRRYFQPARFFLSILFRLCSILPIPQFCKAASLPLVSLREYSYLARAKTDSPPNSVSLQEYPLATASGYSRAGSSSVLSVKYRFHRPPPSAAVCCRLLPSAAVCRFQGLSTKEKYSKVTLWRN